MIKLTNVKNYVKHSTWVYFNICFSLGTIFSNFVLNSTENKIFRITAR